VELTDKRARQAAMRRRARAVQPVMGRPTFWGAVKIFFILWVILVVGLLLRLWNLDGKPLWLDEVITAVLSLGKTYPEFPLQFPLPVSKWTAMFQLNGALTCPAILTNVKTQSVHPPLFFCWMHEWLQTSAQWPVSWVWKLRALPMLFGVGAIAAMYPLCTSAFGAQAGLRAALLMAVSPFAVYLSQEARHYTLPMLLVCVALWCCLQILQDIHRRRVSAVSWMAWVGVNAVGFYVHYFFGLAIAAQLATFAVYLVNWRGSWLRKRLIFLRDRRMVWLSGLSLAALGLILAPWLPTFFSHITRPETNWMKPFDPDWQDRLAPLYQLPLGWLMMIAAVPTEPVGLAVLLGVPVALFGLWVLIQLLRRIPALLTRPRTRLGASLLVLYTGFVLLQFLAIALFLQKDLTQVPRYNFIYFPAVCGLLAAAWSLPAKRKPAQQPAHKRNFNGSWGWIILVGLTSSILVVTSWALPKPYNPTLVAEQLQLEPDRPMVVAMAYKDLQDVALGLSFALALQQNRKPGPEPLMTFLPRSPAYDTVIKAMAERPLPLTGTFNYWFIAPGLRQKDFPPYVVLSDRQRKPKICQQDKQQYHRLGIPYQMYRCK
jgi:uncharacterized membrane protein